MKEAFSLDAPFEVAHPMKTTFCKSEGTRKSSIVGKASSRREERGGLAWEDGGMRLGPIKDG